MNNSDNNTLICLGIITGAHGIHGEVLIKSYTDNWEDIGSYGDLCNKNNTEQYQLHDIRAYKKGVIAKIKNIRYRDQAEALKGTELYVSRSSLPEENDEETWYHVDLIGLTAVDVTGNQIGTVKAVENFGAGDLVDIHISANGKSELIPFTKDYVPAISIAEGTMTVIMPEYDEEEQEN